LRTKKSSCPRSLLSTNCDAWLQQINEVNKPRQTILGRLGRDADAPEFFHDTACEFAASTTFTGDAKLSAKITEAAAAAFAGFSDLVVGYLAANAHVHGILLSIR
tara:strand:+ start:116 stop:430 length:315 start_codon:yes stop_codon:yes gene_type:complete